MPQYRRFFRPGGTYFFTVVTYRRRPFFSSEIARECMRNSFHQVKKAMTFQTLGFVLLPDHLHCIWHLPEGDSDYSKRWGLIKTTFTKRWQQHFSAKDEISHSRKKHRESNIWQRRFWEHTIRDEKDLSRHLDYIHYNPVKHGLVSCAHAWPHSTFNRWVAEGFYRVDWCCGCGEQQSVRPDFSFLDLDIME